MTQFIDQGSVDHLDHMIKTGTTVEQALPLFDQLASVDLHRVIGQWRCIPLPTGHPIDELAEPFGWYGKLFFDPEHVYPLLFRHQERLISIDPRWIPLSWIGRRKLPAKQVLATMAKQTQFMVASTDSHARLRMLHHRGKLSTTVIYDHHPIIVTLRQVTEAVLVGLMEIKNMEVPFFCVMYRD